MQPASVQQTFLLEPLAGFNSGFPATELEGTRPVQQHIQHHCLQAGNTTALSAPSPDMASWACAACPGRLTGPDPQHEAPCLMPDALQQASPTVHLHRRLVNRCSLT